LFCRKIKGLIIGSLVLSFLLSGCSKVTNTETKNIKATILKTDYESSYTTTTYMMSGNSMIPITTCYPEEYNISLEYDGQEYEIDDEQYYNQYKDKQGKEVDCQLEIKRYDDGTDSKNIIKLN
jgi:outer membrane biogenesis lipoprotein LolB